MHAMRPKITCKIKGIGWPSVEQKCKTSASADSSKEPFHVRASLTFKGALPSTRESVGPSHRSQRSRTYRTSHGVLAPRLSDQLHAPSEVQIFLRVHLAAR